MTRFMILSFSKKRGGERNRLRRLAGRNVTVVPASRYKFGGGRMNVSVPPLHLFLAEGTGWRGQSFPDLSEIRGDIVETQRYGRVFRPQLNTASLKPPTFTISLRSGAWAKLCAMKEPEGRNYSCPSGITFRQTIRAGSRPARPGPSRPVRRSACRWWPLAPELPAPGAASAPG